MEKKESAAGFRDCWGDQILIGERAFVSVERLDTKSVLGHRWVCEVVTVKRIGLYLEGRHRGKRFIVDAQGREHLEKNVVGKAYWSQELRRFVSIPR